MFVRWCKRWWYWWKGYTECVKPSGTIYLLRDNCSGIHLTNRAYYIRCSEITIEEFEKHFPGKEHDNEYAKQDRKRDGFSGQSGTDWAWRVRPRIIDIQDQDDCVLGQCFGDYKNGKGVVGITSEWEAYRPGFLDWTGYFFPHFFWVNG